MNRTTGAQRRNKRMDAIFDNYNKRISKMKEHAHQLYDAVNQLINTAEQGEDQADALVEAKAVIEKIHNKTKKP